MTLHAFNERYQSYKKLISPKAQLEKSTYQSQKNRPKSVLDDQEDTLAFRRPHYPFLDRYVIKTQFLIAIRSPSSLARTSSSTHNLFSSSVVQPPNVCSPEVSQIPIIIQRPPLRADPLKLLRELSRPRKDFCAQHRYIYVYTLHTSYISITF